MSSTTHQAISIKSAARKLPIKRKSPDFSNPNPNFAHKTEFQVDDDDEDNESETLDNDQKPPPFKFHRIWTETDEIRFLQGLVDSSSENLIFPRDLHLFYSRFSTTMSQPYTKSQLSEKLRRLRKKFRVISSRISHGLDQSLLSDHDKALFAISKKLWDPNFNSESPFNVVNGAKKKSASVSVNVSFNPTFKPSMAPSIPITVPTHDDYFDDEDCEVEMTETDGGRGEEEVVLVNGGVNDDGARRIIAKTVMEVFEKTLNEVRMAIVDSGTNVGSSQQVKAEELMKRCREQRIAELDVIASRARLVLENSIRDQ